MNFEYYNPIKFIFGEDAFTHLSEICANHKVLLVYGGSSIKKNGVYDQITKILSTNKIPYVDYGNQIATTYQGIIDGIELAKKEEIDAVVEIGGASAMDTGKAIAFGLVHNNLEDYIEGRKKSDNNHVLNIAIPTYPSTGSEANGVSDIMEYKGEGVELFGAWPDYCLMNPKATHSLSKKETAYSVLISFIQTSAWYLGNHKNKIGHGFSKTILQVLLESYKILWKEPNNIEAKENIMWASAVDTMGIFRSGVDNFYPWTLYSISYIARVKYNVSYREALAVAYPYWLKAISKYHLEDIKCLFTNIFEISKDLSDNEVVNMGCKKIIELMRECNVPITLKSYGEKPSKEFIESSLAKEDLGEFSLEEMNEIIAACFE